MKPILVNNKDAAQALFEMKDGEYALPEYAKRFDGCSAVIMTRIMVEKGKLRVLKMAPGFARAVRSVADSTKDLPHLFVWQVQGKGFVTNLKGPSALVQEIIYNMLHGFFQVFEVGNYNTDKPNSKVSTGKKGSQASRPKHRYTMPWEEPARTFSFGQ